MKEFGEYFNRMGSFDYFFDKEKRVVTAYNRRSGSVEKTYELDMLKEKAKKILEENEIKMEEAPQDFVKRAKSFGLDLNVVKDMNEDKIMSMLKSSLSSAYERLEEEERDLLESVPPSEMLGIFVQELTEEKKLGIYMSFIYSASHS